MDDFDMLNAPATGNGVGVEEDPAAAFLAQQESEIAGIENDEGFSILDSGEVPSSLTDSNGGFRSTTQIILLIWMLFVYILPIWASMCVRLTRWAGLLTLAEPV